MHQPRSIRVFVSSTFRDMQAEREELVKRVFPRVRRLCESRGVAWSEVDLRWGVTDEQKAEGAVLPICLAEIDRSRPFFIGLLGQRYGWVPEEIPAGLTDLLPWLAGVSGTSVTEMEILHGVLNDPDAAGHALFYLRDPAWLETRPAQERAVLGEFASADEIALLGPEAAEAAAAERRARLDGLKDRIRGSGHPWWEYPDPVALGERVLADLTEMVERLYPADDTPDALARESASHAAFGAAAAHGHVARPALAARLDAHAASADPPLVVHGPAGSGATALTSTWLEAWGAAHSHDVLVRHHVGATGDSADWLAMAARLVGELAAGHGFGDVDHTALAGDAAGRRAALFAALARAGRAPRRTVLLVDGADLLGDADGAPDLTWLPRDLPPSVRVVVTAGGDRAVAAARHRGWPVLDLPPLDEAERRELIRAFLGRYAKGLDEQHVARLVASPQTGNVLYLRTLLDELRQHGDHFSIGEVIDHYLAAETPDDLLERVFARYEADFERDRPGLVGDAFRALWAARRGLSEPELLGILGMAGGEPGGEPLPHAVWSPLLLAAEQGLVTRSGVLAIASDVHRRAVEDRYLAGPHERAAAHALVARAFAAEPLGPRVVEELPWQQFAAGDVDGLVATLSDLRFMDAAYRQDHGDLRALWARAEAAGRRVVDAYRPLVDEPARDPDAAWQVARLVTDAGYPAEAARLHRFLVDHARREPNPARLRAALVNLGSALWLQGDLEDAEGPLREAIDLARAAGDTVALRGALGNLALCRRDRGGAAEAAALFAEDAALCRQTGDVQGLQATLGNHAQLLRATGQYTAALAMLGEQEELCRATGDSVGVARSLAGQAAVLADQGDPAGALERFRAHGAVSREIGDLRGLAESLLNEAGTLRQLGRRDEAAQVAGECEALVRRLDDQPLLARILDAQSRTAAEEGRWADAARLANEAVLTARAADAPGALVLALGIAGIARRELGDLAGARAAHVEEEQVAAGAHDAAAVAAARVNLAAVDIASGDLDAALARYAQAEPVLRELELHMVLTPMLGNRWQVHLHRGDANAAITDLLSGAASAARIGSAQQRSELLTKAVELLVSSGRMAEAEPVWADLAEACRAVGDEPGIQRAVGERALLVLGRGDLALAGTLLDEQEEICRRIGHQVGLAACVGNRAILKRQQGDLAGSLACVEEQLAIARASGNGQGVLFATANRGDVLAAMGRVAEGIAGLEEARALAAAWNVAPMVAQLDQMIAALRARG